MRVIVLTLLALAVLAFPALGQLASADLSTVPTTPAPVTDGAHWVTRPGWRDFDRNYPERARARGQPGRVVLYCLVRADGRLTCTVRSEDPPGQGFGEAALRVAEAFRMALQTDGGRSTVGGRILVPLTFRLAD